MAYTGIDRYTKPHGSGKNKEGGTRIQIINKGSNTDFNSEYLNVTTLSAHNATIDNLSVKNADIDNAKFVYLMSPNGVINKIQGDELNYSAGSIDDLTSKNISTDTLTVKDEAKIATLISDYINSKNITTDYLTVNKSAHFFELVIDKIRSVQGTQMNTAANCVADYVEAYNSSGNTVPLDANTVSYYRIYWKNTDNDGKAITNDWLVNDQAICESFNVNPGTTYDTENKYYWRLVRARDNGTPKYINFDNNDVRNTAPSTFQINFNNGFQYGSSYSYTDNYQNFTITSQVNGEWAGNSYAGVFTPSSTLYGIQLKQHSSDTRILSGGSLIFDTSKKTKLNVGIYYDDGTFDYKPADTYKTNYVVQPNADKNIEAIIINTAVIDKYDACNWIDLSNVIKDTGVSGKSAIPTIGDNICQLGYRYQNLSSSDLADLGYDSSEVDDAGQSLTMTYNNASDKQAWLKAHKDEAARASAIIIAAYNTPDSDVVPPSYAQYQYINEFNLTNHRGSWFDATGAYFKGNLVAGTVVDQGVSIPVSVDTWRIMSDTSVITRDTTQTVQPPYITLSLLHNDGTNSTVVTTLPNDKKIYVNGQDNSVVNPTDPLRIVMSYFGFNDLNIQLKNTAQSQVFDKLTIDTFDINATNGRNGQYIQFIYKNDYVQPSTPTSSSFPPSGWSTTATTPLDDEYTWMSQRTVTFDNSNNPVYGSWSSPIRISGADGEAGKDGDGVEFIYHQTEYDTQPDLFNSYVDIPDPSLLDANTIQYAIRPPDPGYDTADNLITIWREGLTSHVAREYDYLPPSYQNGATLITGWTDEPQGVDDTYLYEWVSVRTYDGYEQKWGPFSEPVIWAKYGENGINGVDGINGIDGKDGEGWFLVPLIHKFEVEISTGTNYDNITGVVGVNFKFGVQHIDGDTVEWLTAAQLANYSINLITDNTAGNSVQSPATTSITTVSMNGTSIPVISYTNTNYLRYVTGLQSGNTTNWYYLHAHSNESQYANLMFTRISVELVRNGIGKMDTYTQDLKFKADHIFIATDTALNSVYQGLSGDVNPVSGTYAQGFSKIYQAWDNINLNVNNISNQSTLPTSNNLVQYAFYTKNNTTPPTAPSGDVTQSGNVVGQWTTYNYPYPTSSMKYMFMSTRTRSQSMNSTYGSWSNWSSPVIVYTYNGGLATIANSATLDIKANQIQSTVSQTYLSQADAAATYTTQSQVTQTATSISAQVKTDIEGELQTTGIDIENGKINLNADNTNINGNLNVYDNDSGISIYDTSGVLKSQFIARDISSMSDLNFTKLNSVRNNNITQNTIFEFNLGTLESGRKLTIVNDSIRLYYQGDDYETLPIDGTLTLLDMNNNIITTGNINNYTIPSTTSYKLKLEQTISIHYQYIYGEWIFKETLTGSSYVIVGRDGMLVANTNNRLFRVDDNGILLRRQYDAIYFENGTNNTNSLFRLGWNGLNEAKIPFDNYNRTIRIVDYVYDEEQYNDVEIQTSGSTYYYNINSNIGAGTIIVSCGKGKIARTDYHIYLPPTSNTVVGYKFSLVHASIATGPTGNNSIHRIILHTNDGVEKIRFGSTSNAQITMPNMGVYNLVYTGATSSDHGNGWIMSTN